MTDSDKKKYKLPMDSGRFSRRVFDVALDGIAICDEKGVFLDTNQAYCHMTGVSYQDLQGRQVEDFIVQEERDKILKEFISTMRKAGSVRLKATMLHQDGSKIPIELTGARISYEGKPAFLSIVHDLREQKQKEAELLESEERYRILTESVTDGVIVIQGNQLKFVNNAFLSIFNYSSKEDVLMKGLDVLMCPKLQEYFKEKYITLEKGDLSESIIVADCSTNDGREFWAEARCKIIMWEGTPAILATLRDITESMLKQMAVEEERDSLFRENISLRSTMKDRYRLGEIVGKSPAIQKIYDLVIKASASEAGVAVYGDSGTGKELIARTIHEMSSRKEKEFVPVNCGAVQETLFESEFFGHKKGSFTGAHRDKKGFFDAAHGGTLFLDEVGELSTGNQVKLLRAIDGAGYSPVGDEKVKKADVRIIVATNRDPKEMIKKGLMREDFFYRVHIIPITVPPLKDRKDDIPLLVDYFLEKFGGEKKIEHFPLKILEAMYNYEWPGNVRELQNVLQRYNTLGSIDFVNIHEDQPGEMMDMLIEFNDQNVGLRDNLDAFEKQYLVRALDQNRWNRGKTAAMLKIPPKTLYRKMKKYQLS